MKKKKFKIIYLLILSLLVSGAFLLAFLLVSNKPAPAFAYVLPDAYPDGMKLMRNDESIFIKPAYAEMTLLSEAENSDQNCLRKVEYINAYQNTDVVQSVFGYEIKEDIILKQPGHPEIFEFKIDAQGLEARSDSQGNLNFYSQEHKIKDSNEPNPLDLIFTIPAAFMIDANGEESLVTDVKMKFENNILTLTPDPAWLSAHKYPIILDPSVEISILNLYSQPLTGDDWEVNFTTEGMADLIITPNDQATVNDDEFVSLWCGEDLRTPEILSGDIIYFENWECAETGRIIHNTIKAGDHTLKFQFGEEIAYAYNHFSGDRRYAWGENIGWVNASSTHEMITVSEAGLTGYAWGENIGWIKFDYNGTAGATNTTATDWGVTNDQGALSGYAWGENIGWINFNTTHEQVVIDLDNGRFSGYAWGENIGWINFNHDLDSYTMEYTGAPYVTTLPPTGIGSKAITARGISERMGADITERGFKYGLTAADTWTKSETGTYSSGEYELVIDNLSPGTNYFIRAYAVNAEGTGYGEYIQFTTEAAQKGSPIIFKEGVILKEKMILK